MSTHRTVNNELTQYEGRTAGERDQVSRIRGLLADSEPWSRALPLHLTASALVVHPPTRRILLRWHVRQQAWLLIGGHGDPGETDPVAVALREGAEETGLADLRPWPEPEIIHVTVVSVPASPLEPAHEHADIRYVLSTGTPEAVRPETPAATLRWLTVHEGLALTTEENVRETLRRADALL